MCTDIAVLKLFPGINEATVKAVLETPNVKGVVLETYGAGNAPTLKWFEKLIAEALNKEIKIINVTQCAGGSVLMGHYETSSHLQMLGVVSGKDITFESAIAKLMYLLGEEIPDNQFKTIFETPIRGEITA